MKNYKPRQIFVIFLLNFCWIVGLSLAIQAWIHHKDSSEAAFRDSVTIYVYGPESFDAACDSLRAHALRPRAIERVIRSEEFTSERIKQGKYVFKPSHTATEAVRCLINNWQTPTRVTLSGTLRTKARIAQRLSRQLMLDSTSLHNALCDSAFLSRFGFDTLNVFALILPDTYQMYWNISIDDLFGRFKSEYDKFWTPERVELAKAQKLTPMEASILASIIDQETNRSEDYPKMASVYLNRLHGRMKLQACPTITYCYGYTLNRVLKKHLEVDSPFNTYKHYGLPPAPISVPPKAAIEAVLHPDSTKYLFFCASPDFDGTHRFARTLGEHNKNSRDYTKAFNERQKKKAREAAQNLG